ncbi:hypothetical protein RUM44_005787 [Polyplax serrata]|uniref:G-protein coupled receptors family 1 profile domain-containing protein n=1 Tax=Polyplax serrata TaxID=468196 RepID=A0ABR1AY14_POLSC
MAELSEPFSPNVFGQAHVFNVSDVNARELGKLTDNYPKWTTLPNEECERLRVGNGSLWLLLNYYSNLTTGLPVRCLDHAPQRHLSNTIQAIVLGIMFVVSLMGNIMTVYSLTHKHKSNTRQFSSSVYSLIFHLSIADLLVTFTCLLGEAAWSYSVSWLADNFTCKIFKFSQVFSLYLSTFVLVLISLDRFLAVKYPMKTLNPKRRCSRSVILAWLLSLLLSSPQFLIFRVGKGPFYEDFYQCVTYGFYTEPWQEQLYTISSLFLMFILPLTVIVWSYASTFRALAQSENVFQVEIDSGKSSLFRPDLNRRRLMNKAKTKSMRISVVIVITFIICWTPYYFMMILAKDLRNGIFCFGMSNSLLNPIIYGVFHIWKPKNGVKFNYSSKEFYLSDKSMSLRKKSRGRRQPYGCESPPLETTRDDGDVSCLISLEDPKR